MNKRQKKKLIPENTEYCYSIIGRNTDGSLQIKTCPHYRHIGFQQDAFIDGAGNSHPCETPIYYCSYTKTNSNEDYLLSEKIKGCGEKLSKLS